MIFFINNKQCNQKGMALFIALSVMVIFLIMCLGIVNLTTGNLKTVGNISSRLQALNIANAASMYGIYEIKNNTDPNSGIWGPGPTPPANSLSFTEYTNSQLSPHLNDLPGKYKIAYVNNLNNPNNVSLSPPSMFSSVITTSIEVYGETAVIIAQGEYGGFKRTVKTTIKYNYYGSSADGEIKLGDGMVMLNGVRDLATLEPIAGSLYSKKNITYNNINGYKFFNGSVLVSHGSISQDTSAVGTPIPSSFIEENQPEAAAVGDWNINDPNFTGFNPADPNTYLTVPGLTPMTEPNIPVKRPTTFPTPNNPQNYYKGGGGVTLDKNPTYPDKPYFINGNLHCLWNLRLNDVTLIVNGTVTLGGRVYNESTGRLIVAGYYNDNSSLDPNTSFGLSLYMKDLTNAYAYIVQDNTQGVSIITEGDVKLKNRWNPDINTTEWLAAMPEDIMKIKDTFDTLGLTPESSGAFHYWYDTGLYSSYAPKLLLIDGFTGKQMLQGLANENLISMGLKPVPSEVSTWFKHEHVEDGIFDFSDNAFRVNPSIYQNNTDVFLQAVIYTHGMVTTRSPNGPVRIVGGVVSKYNALYSPNPTPADPNASHGGIIDLSNGSSIILYPEAFKSNKPIIKPILTVYAWEEL